MSIASIYSLADAQKATGATRHLVTFLINERQIPVKLVGMAKVIDEDGLKLLRSAIAEYHQKAMATAVSA